MGVVWVGWMRSPGRRGHDRVRRLRSLFSLSTTFVPVVMGYLRIVTHPAIFARPLPTRPPGHRVFPESLAGIPAQGQTPCRDAVMLMML